MAVMHPPRLTQNTLDNPRLRGEVKVYSALSALPDEYEVFHNRSVSRGSSSQAYARRIDFVVLHEKYGFLAIEVKGGKIRIGEDGDVEQYHPSHHRWARINPYKQVELSTMELIRNAKADGANYYIVDNTCVIFPDTLRKDITDAPNRLPNGTLCADDLAILPVQMKTLFSKTWSGDSKKREAFLDMRRRLNNMPEARRERMESSRHRSGSSTYSSTYRRDRSAYQETELSQARQESIRERTDNTPHSQRSFFRNAPLLSGLSVKKPSAFFNQFIDRALLVSMTILVMFLVLIAFRHA